MLDFPREGAEPKRRAPEPGSLLRGSRKSNCWPRPCRGQITRTPRTAFRSPDLTQVRSSQTTSKETNSKGGRTQESASSSAHCQPFAFWIIERPQGLCWSYLLYPWGRRPSCSRSKQWPSFLILQVATRLDGSLVLRVRHLGCEDRESREASRYAVQQSRQLYSLVLVCPLHRRFRRPRSWNTCTLRESGSGQCSRFQNKKAAFQRPGSR